MTIQTNTRTKYKIFVSHSWKYGEEYKRFINLLDNAKRFGYMDYSVPEEDPLTIYNPQTPTELYNKLRRQIQPVQIVILLGGMYASYSKVIPDEIEIAREFGKPFIVVKPWGNDRIPSIATGAKEIVNWNSESIINAIRKYAV